MRNNYLLRIERLIQIQKLIEASGRVMVPELSARFSVSKATIRRDLDELDGRGWLHRTHGGAVRVFKAKKEPPIFQRSMDQKAEKGRIGLAAAQEVKDGETIFLGSGSTVMEIARHLPQDLSLTVITNSLSVINDLIDLPTIELIVIGGMLRQTEYSMVGHIAEQAVRELRADHIFIGIRAIDPQQGLTNDFFYEAMTDRAILSIAPHIVIVADHTKFGRVSSVLVAPLTVADLIITDKAAPEHVVANIRKLGIEVKLV